MRVGSSVGDLSAALFGVIGILAAWGRAKENGQGAADRYLDVRLSGGSVRKCNCAFTLTATSLSRSVPAILRLPLSSFFQASDSYIVIAAGNDSLWQKLCSALGREELAADSRFVDNALRTKNHAEL